ncbi:GTPase [Candidatus Phytoplasma australasiaticum]
MDNSSKTRFLKEGIKTLILGKPNVGKSSLLNSFLGEERAIVSDIPGTTRDFLDVYVNVNGVNLRLIDTAGIHHTEDYLEILGVNIAKKLLKTYLNLIIINCIPCNLFNLRKSYFYINEVIF